MSAPAPIALFTHANPDRVAATIDSLRACDEARLSVLTVFCDGAGSPAEAQDVARVREIVAAVDGFRDVVVVECPEYVGRSRLLAEGVSKVVSEHDSVIVVEDDLVVSPSFLRFVNDGLDAYADEESVVSICGYSYRIRPTMPETYFLPGAHCWGWATWRRGWNLYRNNADELASEIMETGMIHAFDGGGAEPLTRLLAQSEPDDDSTWSLCWMAAATLGRRMTLHPGRSLVRHVDYSGEESGVAPVFESPLSADHVEVERLPVEVNKGLHRELSRSFIRWRGRNNRRFRLYSMLTTALPMSIEERLYSAMVRKSLRNLPRRPRRSAHTSATSAL